MKKVTVIFWLLILLLPGCSNQGLGSAQRQISYPSSEIVSQSPESEIAPSTGRYVCENSLRESFGFFDLFADGTYSNQLGESGNYEYTVDAEAGQSVIYLAWMTGPYINFNKSFYYENEFGGKSINLLGSSGRWVCLK